jgi:CheY-like chemotaxis protein
MEATPRPRVLYVDDNRDVADSAGELLRLVGFDTRVCYDGQSALAAAAEFLPDVCLLDYHMPGMCGDELAVRLRDGAAGRPVYFVAVTAMGDVEYREKTHTAGFSLHLIKPVDPHQMLRVVDELWARMHAATPHTSRPEAPPPPAPAHVILFGETIRRLRADTDGAIAKSREARGRLAEAVRRSRRLCDECAELGYVRKLRNTARPGTPE